MNTDSINFKINDTFLENLIVSRARHLFMKLGIKSVSMDDVAVECGISKKTLYKCFDKESLVMAVTNQQVQIFEARINSILAENRDIVPEMTGLLLFTMDAVQEISFQFLYSVKVVHPKAYRCLEEYGEHIQQAFEVNLTRGMEQGYYRADIEPSIIVRLYFAQLMELIEQQTFDRSSQWIEELYKFFLFGVLTTKGQQLL